MKRLTSLGILLIAILSIIACQEAAPAASATAQLEPTATPDIANPEATLRESFRRLEEIESFHIDMDMSFEVGGGGFTFEMLMDMNMDYSLPDKAKGVASVTLLDEITRLEVISISDDYYFRDPPRGRWEKEKAESAAGGFFSLDNIKASLGFSSDENEEDDPLRGTDNIRFAGEETIDGITMLRITGTINASELGGEYEDAKGALVFDYWVGKDNLLIYQIVMFGDVRFRDDDGTFVDAAMRIEGRISKYNEPVEIEAP